LNYYKLGDTSSAPRIYEAYDIDTKCPDFDLNLDSSNFEFLQTRLDTNSLILFEKRKKSKPVNRDYSSMGGSYYPLSSKFPVGNPISFIREYKSGIPLETNYYYSDGRLMVQYYEWSSLGCECFNNVSKSDFETTFHWIKTEIIKKKGKPVKIIEKEKQIEIIWDNSEEHLELHLYLYHGFRIRLIDYWKSK